MNEVPPHLVNAQIITMVENHEKEIAAIQTRLKSIFTALVVLALLTAAIALAVFFHSF
jgi:cation transport ATPase